MPGWIGHFRFIYVAPLLLVHLFAVFAAQLKNRGLMTSDINHDSNFIVLVVGQEILWRSFSDVML